METMERMEKGYCFDPAIECDAPTYVDFTDLAGEYEDNADEWFDRRAEEEIKFSAEDIKESPPEEVEKASPEGVEKKSEEGAKGSSPIGGRIQSAANALAEMIASGTGTIAKLKSRILPQPSAQSKPAGPTRSLARARYQKKETTDKYKCNDPVKNFANSLRSDAAANRKLPPSGRVKVKPFVFACDKRAALRSANSAVSSDQSERHIPAAEFVAKFHKTTPPRFRRTPRNQKYGDSKPPGKAGGQSGPSGCHMTVPKTPVLLTRTRSRPVAVKGAKEIEEEELAAIKENQFKATVLDRRVIDKHGMYGVPRKRGIYHLTEPHTPDFASKLLAKKRRTVNETDGEATTTSSSSSSSFQAKPMPDFSKIKGVPPKRPHPLTEPESPAIVKRPRTASYPRQAEKEEAGRVRVARPAPKLDKVFTVKYPDRPPLQPQPFSFEERDKNKTNTKTNTEEMYVFTARAVPDFSKTGLPPKSVAPLVMPTPFELQTDKRGEKHVAKFERKLEERQMQEKNQREFKAKKDEEVSSVLYSEPFMPEKPQYQPASVDNFVLNTELRSQERSKYDSQRQYRTCLLEATNLQRRALREAEEAKEIAEYRKTLVHKPQPIGAKVRVQHTSSTVPSDKS